MPLLQRQSYRGLTRSTSKAAWHSLLLSSMASFSLPTRHWRITRYRELQLGFWLHISLAWMQSTHSDWAPGPELWRDPGELRTKDTDRAEGPTLELSPSSGWGQETDVKVTGEWFMCIRNQFYMLFFFFLSMQQVTVWAGLIAPACFYMLRNLMGRHLQYILHGSQILTHHTFLKCLQSCIWSFKNSFSFLLHWWQYDHQPLCNHHLMLLSFKGLWLI